jgi:hypothetical protein
MLLKTALVAVEHPVRKPVPGEQLFAYVITQAMRNVSLHIQTFVFVGSS